MNQPKADVHILNYGVGNLASIVNMLGHLGYNSRLAATAEEINAAERIILPGVGAFDRAMSSIMSLGLTEPIRAFASSGRPLLGVCLGMQLLLQGSEEGELTGLGIIPGFCRRFTAPTEDVQLRVPHMGWSRVTGSGEQNKLIAAGAPRRFYFVHSYAARDVPLANVAGWTDYGGPFASAVYSGRVYGVQFHPEKSHQHGMALLKNFVELV